LVGGAPEAVVPVVAAPGFGAVVVVAVVTGTAADVVALGRAVCDETGVAGVAGAVS